MFGDILSVPDLRECDVSSLKTTLMAGAPCPVHLAKSVVDNLKIQYFVVFAYIFCLALFFTSFQLLYKFGFVSFLRTNRFYTDWIRFDGDELNFIHDQTKRRLGDSLLNYWLRFRQL